MTAPDPSKIDEGDPLCDSIHSEHLTPIIPLIPRQEEPETPESNDPDIGDEPEED